jgi:hypothetical protein
MTDRVYGDEAAGAGLGPAAAAARERAEAAERCRRAKEDLKRLATDLFPDGTKATLLVIGADGSQSWVKVALVTVACAGVVRATLAVVGCVAPAV